jgi:hypothetical protein
MCQFINRNNVYGFKIIAHTITKSLVIPSGSMARKKKTNAWWPPGIMVKVKKKFIDSKYPRIYINIFLQQKNSLIIFGLYAIKEKKQTISGHQG